MILEENNSDVVERRGDERDTLSLQRQKMRATATN